jgi:protein-tyrosine phosphatase
MDWITDQVAIGNYLEAQDPALLKQHGFRAIVSLDGSLTESQATELGLAEVAAYRLIDGTGNDLHLFRRAVADLCRLASWQPPVLVHCHAGRSRAAAVVAGYLMRQQDMAADVAVAAVAARREICITGALMDLLEQLKG